jgi:hypothetical protein
MEACYGGTDVMERSCAVARGIDINTVLLHRGQRQPTALLWPWSAAAYRIVSKRQVMVDSELLRLPGQWAMAMELVLKKHEAAAWCVALHGR